MIYVWLLLAGGIVSFTHVYLVWKNRDGVRYSISEHAVADTKSYRTYAAAHLITDIFFVLYAYEFYHQMQNQNLLFELVIAFITLDILQAVLPSKGKTKSIHFASAYLSWFIYQLVGVLSLFLLHISQPYFAISIAVLSPVLLMFIYMHFKRDKLWPYQLLMVPLYVLFLLFVTIGSSSI